MFNMDNKSSESWEKQIHRKNTYEYFKNIVDSYYQSQEYINDKNNNLYRVYYEDMYTLLLVIESYQQRLNLIGMKLKSLRFCYNKLQKAHLKTINSLAKLKNLYKIEKAWSDYFKTKSDEWRSKFYEEWQKNSKMNNFLQQFKEFFK